MLHVQLQRFPHSARAFNLSEEEVRTSITEPWEAGRLIEFGERFWTPGECKLTILAGPALDPGELGMGRGWAAAQKRGRDVTAELIQAPAAADPFRAAPGPPFADLKDEVLGLAARRATPLPEIWRLAAARYPERALSESLALAERAIGELLHDELAELTADRVLPGREVVLRAWNTWVPDPWVPDLAGPRPAVWLRATARGRRARRAG